MSNHPDFEKQFALAKEYYLEKLDLIDWLRFFYAIKEILNFKPRTVLDIGEGSGIVRKATEGVVEKYETMDVNARLAPTYAGDVREYRAELAGKFDGIVAMEILEHIPFEDVKRALKNLRAYLTEGGRAIITIPYRASYFFWMTPTYIPHILRVATGFLSWGAFYRRFIKRKIWIDPSHEWEIGDGHHTLKQVENMMRAAGFKIETSRQLIYARFWVLSK